jgi:hypothetical protein
MGGAHDMTQEETKKCDDRCFKMGMQPNNLADFNFSQNPNWANWAILKSDSGIWQAPVLKPKLPNGPLVFTHFFLF